MTGPGKGDDEVGDLELAPHQRNDPSRSDQRAQQVLGAMHRVAVWGASDNGLRKSYRVVRFLADQGIAVVPLSHDVNIAGVPTVPNLEVLEPPPDVVAVFCEPAEVAGVAQQLIDSPVLAVWFQEGLIDRSAADLLEAAGKLVIMDRCVMRDYRRHVLGEEVESWFPV